MTKPEIDGIIFDLDGTIYLGEATLPGAKEAVAELRGRGKKTLFVTNKPLYPREEYADKLTRLGIPTGPESIITSGLVMGYYLEQNHRDAAIYVVGEENLKNEFRERELNVLPEYADQDPMEVIEPQGVDVVVVAFDRTLDYRKLNTAYQALINGAKFFATNPDKMCPMPGGGIPDAGGTIIALEHMTGRKLDVLAGKPSPVMVQVASDMMGLPPERCVMVGDRLETDVRMGKEAGMYAASVLTGAATRDMAEAANPKPDFILNNVGELPSILI